MPYHQKLAYSIHYNIGWQYVFLLTDSVDHYTVSNSSKRINEVYNGLNCPSMTQTSEGHGKCLTYLQIPQSVRPTAGHIAVFS